VKAEISGQMHLLGPMTRPRLSGDLLVQQADIRLGDLMNTPSSGWETWPMVQSLQMNMSIRADQQVWVRDQTFNIEMTGDLDVVKDADGFKVFGDMQSRRGNYIFQNRRLDIARGEIQFQGKSTIDPNLDIEAQTRVRARLAQADVTGDRTSEQVVVIVSVGGTLSHPDIKLSSEPQVGDGKFEEVLSVLLVGAVPSVVDVTQAGDFVLSTLANRFGQRLGEDLKLDLVEVDVAESNISRVRVGKYLTPRLFVSYAQDMGSTGREVAVEFKLLPNLTLEAKQIDAGNEDQITSQRRETIGMVWQKEW
jgi:translocation and assembly module TamB